jgi:AmmeMemoRadiSam system protein B
MPVLFAMEDSAATPLGNLEIDSELRNSLIKNLENIPNRKYAEDRYQDNTVEVLLPMVKYFFPGAKLLWIRLPSDMVSFETGKLLAKTAGDLGRKLAVLGSTDLTHYGTNYRFSPKGSGKEALDWVKNVNDRRFIDAVEAGDPEAVLDRAENEYSACSAWAVLGVMGYVEEVRANGKSGSQSAGKLLAYATSADLSIEQGEGVPDSFVGYGAFVFS